MDNRHSVVPVHFLQDQAEHVTELVAATVENEITRARVLLELGTRLLQGLPLQTDGTDADQLRGNMINNVISPDFLSKVSTASTRAWSPRPTECVAATPFGSMLLTRLSMSRLHLQRQCLAYV